jgi:hypothetical protein
MVSVTDLTEQHVVYVLNNNATECSVLTLAQLLKQTAVFLMLMWTVYIVTSGSLQLW